MCVCVCLRRYVEVIVVTHVRFPTYGNPYDGFQIHSSWNGMINFPYFPVEWRWNNQPLITDQLRTYPRSYEPSTSHCRDRLERPNLGMISFSLILSAVAMQAANAGLEEAESVLAKMESIARGVRDDLEIAHSARCDPVILTECASQNYNDCSSKFPQPQCGLEFDEKSPPSECSCGSECDRIYSSCARILLLTLNQAFAPVFAQRISIVGHVDFDHRYAVIPFRGKRHSERRRSS